MKLKLAALPSFGYLTLIFKSSVPGYVAFTEAKQTLKFRRFSLTYYETSSRNLAVEMRCSRSRKRPCRAVVYHSANLVGNRMPRVHLKKRVHF